MEIFLKIIVTIYLLIAAGGFVASVADKDNPKLESFFLYWALGGFFVLVVCSIWNS
jgi:hypothetical protein